jgi:hypothetical protein
MNESAQPVEPGDWAGAARAGMRGRLRKGHHLVVVRRGDGTKHIRWDDGAEVEWEPKAAGRYRT